MNTPQHGILTTLVVKILAHEVSTSKGINIAINLECIRKKTYLVNNEGNFDESAYIFKTRKGKENMYSKESIISSKNPCIPKSDEEEHSEEGIADIGNLELEKDIDQLINLEAQLE